MVFRPTFQSSKLEITPVERISFTYFTIALLTHSFFPPRCFGYSFIGFNFRINGKHLTLKISLNVSLNTQKRLV